MALSLWMTVLFSLSAVLAQRRPQTGMDDESRFVITGVNRRGDSSDRLTDKDSSGRNRRGGSAGRFADFFRIETEIQRLDNPAGILANGKKCDFTGACDPVVTAFLDLESPLSPWPGSVAASKWKTIFEATDQNSPTIGRSVIRDMCGGSASNVNLRVLVNDADSLSSQDEIGKFSCLFQLDARDVAMDSLSAQWGPSTECTAEAQQGKIRLFARRRAFEIPSTSCRAPSSL